MVPFAAGEGSWPLALLALLGLLMVSFFFSGTETAYFSLQRVERQRLADNGKVGARILSLLERRAALISSILLANETANVAIATLGAFVVAALFPGRDWLNVVLVTPLILLLTEITPKIIAFRYNVRWARTVVWPLSAFVLLVTPLRLVLAGLVTLLARPFGVRGPQLTEGLAEAEIRTLLEQGAASGGVDEREREIIEAVFQFDDLTIGRVITPRPDIFAVPFDVSWEELLQRCREAGHSRVPIYQDRLDNIVGVLLLKDLLKYRKRPPAGPRQLRSMLLPPTFVPRSKSADSMLREFMERRSHMAFVVNEHGMLVGLVTLDDLLTELVGEILEGDDEEAPEVQRGEAGTLHVRGSMDLEDFDDETGIHLPEGEYRTLGGFVFHQLGRLPHPGDAVVHDGYRFTVAEMEGMRITELRIEPLASSTESQEAM